MVLLTLPYIAVSSKNHAEALDAIVDRLTNYMDSLDTNETSYITPFITPNDEVPPSPVLCILTTASERLLKSPFTMATDQNSKGEAVGYSVPPPSMVRLPHRTRIKHQSSPYSCVHTRFIIYHSPIPRTRILLLHLPPPRETGALLPSVAMIEA